MSCRRSVSLDSARSSAERSRPFPTGCLAFFILELRCGLKNEWGCLQQPHNLLNVKR